MNKLTHEDLIDPNIRLLCIRDDDEDMWTGEILCVRHYKLSEGVVNYVVGVLGGYVRNSGVEYTLAELNCEEAFNGEYIHCIRIDNMSGKDRLAMKMRTGWDVKV